MDTAIQCKVIKRLGQFLDYDKYIGFEENYST